MGKLGSFISKKINFINITPTKKLANFMRWYPNYEIIPMIEQEAQPNLWDGYILGEIRDVLIDKYTLINGEVLFFSLLSEDEKTQYKKNIFIPCIVIFICENSVLEPLNIETKNEASK